MSVKALITCFNKDSSISAVIDACRKCATIDEIHIYDDGSTDQSLKILLQREAQGDIFLHSDGRNRGVAEARNLLQQQVSAEIYVFIDGDDIVEPSSKDEQILAVKRNRSAIFSYSDYRRKSVAGVKYIAAGEFTNQRLGTYNFIPFSSVVTRKRFLFSKVHHEDYFCWLTELKKLKSCEIHYFREATFVYDGITSGISANWLKGIIANIKVKRLSGMQRSKILISTLLYCIHALRKRTPTMGSWIFNRKARVRMH